MKIIIALVIILSISACGSSSSDDKPTMIVIGDSLCSEGWPELINNYDVDNRCVGGMGLVDSPWGISSIYGQHPVYADITVIALGVNDAVARVSADDFELAYRSLVDVVANPVCLLPPFTDRPKTAEIVAEYHNRLIVFCPNVLYYSPSNDEDGVHYTLEGDKENAAIVSEFIARYQ